MYGDWCPGDETHEAHPSGDLTADHIYPRSDYGDNGPLRVLCRAANSRRGRGAVSLEEHNAPWPPLARAPFESFRV